MGGPRIVRDCRERGYRMNVVVVTRHKALVQYLIETGVITADAPVIFHATPENVVGRDVIGILPMRLAALARSITEIEMHIPESYRGRELTIEEVRLLALGARRYVVTEIDHDE